MARRSNNGNALGFMLVTLLFLCVSWKDTAEAQTRVGYYSDSCPNLESLVKASVNFLLNNDFTLAPALIRMHFHDCFVQGCDGSILLDGPGTERTAGANTGVRGFEVIMDAKARVEAACPATVSCADILTLAARDAVAFAGGPTWDPPLGRLDGRVSAASAIADFPSPRDGVPELRRKFRLRGLPEVRQLVALSGAHTVGTAECRFFSYRLRNGGGGGGPPLSASAVQALSGVCPADGSGESNVAALDRGSRTMWDVSFFRNVLAGNAPLESDSSLATDPATAPLVRAFAASQADFDAAFTDAMIALSNVGVKTAPGSGEIRRMCSIANF